MKKISPLLLIGSGILLLWGLMAIAAPFYPHKPDGEAIAALKRPPPSWSHPFGTDRHGRDVCSRVLWGSRISLMIVFGVIMTTFPGGVIIGMLAGFFGGWIEKGLMTLTDMFLAFPRLLFVMALTAVLGRSLSYVIIAMALASWPGYARLARAETLIIRKQSYIEAARAIGASEIRILFAHILPMCLPTLLVRLSLSIGPLLLTAAGLNFLGFGVRLPTPEWGFMVSDGLEDFFAGYWWIAVFPALAIMLVVIGCNFIGEALRDHLDPRKD